MKPWSPGSFAKGNAANNTNKAMKQAVQGLSMIANTFEQILTTGEGKSKGNGKGSSKGDSGPPKGGGKGHTAAPDGSWYCQRQDCAWAEAGKHNMPWRNQCGCCLHKKGEAMNPPSHSRITTRQPPSISSKQKAKAKEETTKSKAEEARAAKEKVSYSEKVKAEAQARVPTIAPPKKLDMDVVHKDAEEAKAAQRLVAFTEEAAKSFATVTPALLEVMESLRKERKPLSTLPTKDVSETADAFIKDSRPVSKGLELVKARRQLKGESLHPTPGPTDAPT